MAKTKLAYINDLDVWEFICGLTNFSAWVRDKARAEIKKQAGIDPELADYIEGLLSKRLVGRVQEAIIVSDTGVDGEIDPDAYGFF